LSATFQRAPTARLQGKVREPARPQLQIEIFARGSELNNIGLLVDFVELKEAADELVTYLDHKNLNELEAIHRRAESSLRMSRGLLLERLAVKINDDRVQIYKVKCWETPTSVATYRLTKNNPQISQITQIRNPAATKRHKKHKTE